MKNYLITLSVENSSNRIGRNEYHIVFASNKDEAEIIADNMINQIISIEQDELISYGEKYHGDYGKCYLMGIREL